MSSRRRRHLGDTEAGRVRHKLAVLVVVVVVLAAAAAALLRYLPDDSTAPQAGSTPVLDQPPASGPGLRLPAASAPAVVLHGLDPNRPVVPATLRAVISPLASSPVLGKHVGFVVARLGAERPLVQTGRPDTVTPASTLKLLTVTTALETIGPGHRFATSVVRGRTPGQVVLVGGGDPLLTDRRPAPAGVAMYPQQATLQQLAARTADRLKRDGRRTVTLRYDDSLFTGPAVNQHWEPGYIPESVVSPITALWVDEGRAVRGLAQRVTDPSAEAARRFAGLLDARGIEVQGTPTQGKATPGGATLAVVRSAPLAEIVQHVLELSDNEGAEVLLRQAALATGRPGSFTGGVKAVRATLADLGIDLTDARLVDGSGLARGDLLPVGVLVEVLQVAAEAGHGQLRPVESTLPVAGFSGSLVYRFVDDAPDGLGMVRAKTGTLTAVHALAGVAVTRDGRGLVFAVVADQVPVRKTLDARAQLDRIAAALAGCGC